MDPTLDTQVTAPGEEGASTRSVPLWLLVPGGLAAIALALLVTTPFEVQSSLPLTPTTQATPTTAASLPTDPTSAVTFEAEFGALQPITREVVGALPDGTPFELEVALAPLARLRAESITAAIVMDADDGVPRTIGVTIFRRSVPSGSDLVALAGEWAIGIDVDDPVRSALGADWEDQLTVHMSTRDVNGYPVLDLERPLRFAHDDEGELPMEVSFGEFAVRRGCGPDAFRCSDTGAVQLVGSGEIDLLAAADPGRVWIRSSAPRPTMSAFDPGPLDPLSRPIVAWTGTEMLVFGGRPQEGTDPLQGALYDPQSGRWREMPLAPAGTGARVGAWVGDRLVTVSAESTMAFVPGAMRWERSAEGASGVTDLVYDGERLIAWGDRVAALDPATGEWTHLDDLPSEIDGAWERSLRVADGRVYALGMNPHACGEYRMWALEGTRWRPLPDKSIATSRFAQCNLPHDSAGVGDGLLIWEDVDRPSALYEPSSDVWVDLEPPPIGACEGGTTPIWIGERLLVDSCGTSAIFDVDNRSWRVVALPGRIEPDTAVWTGKELLVWSSGWPVAQVDAWRWTPPGGDR